MSTTLLTIRNNFKKLISQFPDDKFTTKELDDVIHGKDIQLIIKHHSIEDKKVEKKTPKKKKKMDWSSVDTGEEPKNTSDG